MSVGTGLLCVASNAGGRFSEHEWIDPCDEQFVRADEEDREQMIHCDQDRICDVDRGFHDSGFATIRGKLEIWNRPRCCP